MDRYIGLDAHSQSCTLAVVGPSGRRLGSQVVETSRRDPTPRHRDAAMNPHSRTPNSILTSPAIETYQA
jgi:hypothetical protein